MKLLVLLESDLEIHGENCSFNLLCYYQNQSTLGIQMNCSSCENAIAMKKFNACFIYFFRIQNVASFYDVFKKWGNL